MRDVRDASEGLYHEGVLAEGEEFRLRARFRMAVARFNKTLLKQKPVATAEDIMMRLPGLRGHELPGMPNPSVMSVLVRTPPLTLPICMGLR